MSSSAVQPLLALLAYPLGVNPTQYMVEQACAHHSLDWRYLTFEVGPADLGDAIRGLRALGFRGGHCAGVHKQAIVPLLDRCTDAAVMLGAANIVFREENVLVGDNSDGRAVLQAIRAVLDPAERNAVILGAGYMAKAVAIELLGAGIGSLTLVNRTESRAAELAASLGEKFQTPIAVVPWADRYEVPAEANLLVNATSLGDGNEEAELPLQLDSLGEELAVVDVTHNTSTTRLLREAAERECTTVDGLSILVEQVALDLQRWTSTDIDRQVLRDAAEEFLGL